MTIGVAGECETCRLKHEAMDQRLASAKSILRESISLLSRGNDSCSALLGDSGIDMRGEEESSLEEKKAVKTTMEQKAVVVDEDRRSFLRRKKDAPDAALYISVGL